MILSGFFEAWACAFIAPTARNGRAAIWDSRVRNSRLAMQFSCRLIDKRKRSILLESESPFWIDDSFSFPRNFPVRRLPRPDSSFTLEAHAHHRRTIRESGSDHGALAGSGGMPVGSRTDLRYHQALHAGGDLRSPRSHRQPRFADLPLPTSLPPLPPPFPSPIPS